MSLLPLTVAFSATAPIPITRTVHGYGLVYLRNGSTAHTRLLVQMDSGQNGILMSPGSSLKTEFSSLTFSGLFPAPPVAVPSNYFQTINQTLLAAIANLIVLRNPSDSYIEDDYAPAVTQPITLMTQQMSLNALPNADPNVGNNGAFNPSGVSKLRVTVEAGVGESGCTFLVTPFLLYLDSSTGNTYQLVEVPNAAFTVAPSAAQGANSNFCQIIDMAPFSAYPGVNITTSGFVTLDKPVGVGTTIFGSALMGFEVDQVGGTPVVGGIIRLTVDAIS